MTSDVVNERAVTIVEQFLLFENSAFSLSIEIAWSFPFLSIMIVLSLIRFFTVNGPSYGGSSGLRGRSILTRTLTQVFRLS